MKQISLNKTVINRSVETNENRKILNIFEILLIIITFLSIFTHDIFFDFYPFKDYYNNLGIIIISTTAFIFRAIFIICFVILSLEKFKKYSAVLRVYITSALVIGFLQWYELYYGSTFYYGEVRDKQGLMFPFLASLMVTLVIWKINYSKTTNRNIIIKILLVVIINVLLYFLWTIVYESWNLLQS